VCGSNVLIFCKTCVRRYAQYEWAVALDKAHGCFSALFDMMDRNITNRVGW